MKTRTTSTVWLALFGLLLAPNARAFYNPSTGRWLNRDPAEEDGGKNLYSFACNDAADGADTDGRSTMRNASGAAPPTQPQPTSATRSVQTLRAQRVFCIYQVLIVFKVVISDAANKPMPGLALSESIVLIDRHRLISWTPYTRGATTDSQGSVLDNYYTSYSAKSGYAIVKQTITAAGRNALFYTFIYAPGTWTGGLRSAFH